MACNGRLIGMPAGDDSGLLGEGTDAGQGYNRMVILRRKAEYGGGSYPRQNQKIQVTRQARCGSGFQPRYLQWRLHSTIRDPAY